MARSPNDGFPAEGLPELRDGSSSIFGIFGTSIFGGGSGGGNGALSGVVPGGTCAMAGIA